MIQYKPVRNRGLVARVWDSPTLTTWASFGVRSLSLVIILPLVLRRFTPEEMTLWQVFATLIGLQILADLGFGTTFARLIAYAMGGASSLCHGEMAAPLAASKNEPNWALMGRISSTMRAIYRRLSLLLLACLLFVGTWFVAQPISATNASRDNCFTGIFTHVEQGWLAWAFVVLTSVVTLCYNGYSAYLQGTNHIALLRRWETFFGLGTIISCWGVLLMNGGVLGLVATNQLWALASIWRNRSISGKVGGGRWGGFPSPVINDDVFAAAWPQAWRSAMGMFATTGFVIFSGLIYAQTGDSVAIASYLLGLRLVQTVNQLAQAPFYSKVPLLTQLWTQGNADGMRMLAERGMSLAFWSFVVPFIVLGVFGPSLLALIGSQTPFPNPGLWLLLGFAFYIERYGAMHLQWYSITGDIRWHVANGITGCLFCAIAAVLYPLIDVYALPLAMLLGYIGFYSWYSARYTYRTFHLHWPKYDINTAGWPSVLMIAFAIYSFLVMNGTPIGTGGIDVLAK